MSDCEVCIGDYGCGFWIEDYAISYVRSSVEATCCECGETIPALMEYERASGTDEEGDSVSYDTCLDCADIATALGCGGSRIHTMLWEALEETDAFENFSQACIAKLTRASAKQKLLDGWRKWKGLAT